MNFDVLTLLGALSSGTVMFKTMMLRNAWKFSRCLRSKWKSTLIHWVYRLHSLLINMWYEATLYKIRFRYFLPLALTTTLVHSYNLDFFILSVYFVIFQLGFRINNKKIPKSLIYNRIAFCKESPFRSQRPGKFFKHFWAPSVFKHNKAACKSTRTMSKHWQ